MRKHIYIIAFIAAVGCGIVSCGNTKKATAQAEVSSIGPRFNADSAYAFCAAQCDFGARTMNSEAHEKCARWIVGKFEGYGMDVVEQKATLTGWDGTPLRATNIIASFKPKATDRVLVCAHWDSRPWADNDPDSTNWRKPVMAANDGASGVAVMIELARIISSADSLNVGVDFVCFDAEDWGVPQWSDAADSGESWALGAKHWVANPHRQGYKAMYGILLDMVGAQGAKFYQEGVSLHYARPIVEKVWAAAAAVGYGSFFPTQEGGMITDDHGPVNEVAGIPTIDIIPYFPDCQQSSFGPTWHTVGDDMSAIDKASLEAVGQTVVQVLYSEK